MTPGYGEKILHVGYVQKGGGVAGCMTVVTLVSSIDLLTPTLENVGTVNDPHCFPLC